MYSSKYFGQFYTDSDKEFENFETIMNPKPEDTSSEEPAF